MKKFSYTLLLLLFAFFACQTEEGITEVEAFEINDTGVKQYRNAVSFGTFNPIPAAHAKDAEAYVRSQLFTSAEDEETYGCLTFYDDGTASIDPECYPLTSGIPERFKDCDKKGRETVACGFWDLNEDCLLCAVVHIIECDGRLGWVLGYEIICLNGGIQPL